MTLLSLPLLWAAAGLYIIWRLISALQAERRFRRFATSHGCEAVYQAQDQKWPWGLDRMYKVLTARKRGMDPLDDYFAWPLISRRSNLRMSKRFWRLNSMIGLSVSGDIHSRALLRPQFARELVNDLEATEKATHTLFEAFGPVDEDGWTELQDVKPMLLRFVLDTATSFLFGESVESQRALMTSKTGDNDDCDADTGRLAGSNEFAEAFDETLFPKQYKALQESHRRLQEPPKPYRQPKIAAAAATRGSKSNPLGAKTEKQIRSPLLPDATHQGRNRTPRPDPRRPLRQPRHNQQPDPLDPPTARSTSAHLPQAPPSRDGDLPSLGGTPGGGGTRSPRLHLLEILPVHPTRPPRDPAPLPARPAQLPRRGPGHRGQQVLWNIYAMHRRPDLWGDDALEFRPERWEDPHGSRLVGGGFAFTPFSAGPRICLGQQYALTEAGYWLVRFVQKYDRIELDPQSEAAKQGRVKKTIGLTLAPVEVRLRVHEAGL
ncbi:hypothetical protein KC363_g64 [Hortaea werneckii]|nr:hypothetical protein KC363_g64 [Hortaea werneckii]